MTTSPIMTVTDEMLAELDRSVRVAWPDDYPAVIAAGALAGKLRRLRAENAELAQSLAESRANDQAAMGWLASLRLASGDRGERMMPELVAHIEELKRDAERYHAWELIIDEIERRAGKECCVEHGCDFTVTIMHDDYVAARGEI